MSKKKPQDKFYSWREGSVHDIPVVEADTLQGCISRTKHYLNRDEPFVVYEGGRDGTLVYNSDEEKKLTAEETVTRFQGLIRGLAIAAANEDGLSRREKCAAVASGTLLMMDGKTSLFPKCNLMPSPDYDDNNAMKANGDLYFEEDMDSSGDIAATFDKRFRDGDWLEHPEEARAYTPDEIREFIILCVMRNVEYWEGNLKAETDLAACNGTAFSILADLDGCSLNMARMDVTLDLDDLNARPELSTFTPTLLPDLHDNYYQVEPLDPTLLQDLHNHEIPAQANLYSVSVPGSVESSDYYVVAFDESHAANIYVENVVGDKISVDIEEMSDAGEILVKHVGMNPIGDPRVISWGSDDEITTRVRPYSKTTVELKDVPSWDGVEADEGMEP